MLLTVWLNKDDWYINYRSSPQLIDKVVLVKNGEFAGVVDYSKDLGERYGLFCALISDYIDAPLHFCIWEGYGSSDHDMMHESNYYLQRV